MHNIIMGEIAFVLGAIGVGIAGAILYGLVILWDDVR